MSTRIYLGALVLALVLQSCLATKTYKKPELYELETLYRYFDKSDTSSIGQMPWKTIFKDKLLQEYIQEALVANYDIQTALQNILIAESNYKQGRDVYLPFLDTQLEANKNISNTDVKSSSFTPGQTYQLSGTLTWNADLWGALRSTRRASLLSLFASDAAYRVVQTQLVSSIASSYYQLMALDSQRLVIDETIENRHKNVETMMALKKSGSQNEVAVQQAKAQYLNAKVTKTQLIAQIEVLENTLCILLGRTPQSIPRSTFEPAEIKIISLGIPTGLLRNRPDIIQAEFELIEKFELTNVAKANMYPKLTISATAGFENTDINQWFNAHSLFSTLMANLAQPILNGRKKRTQWEVAKLEQKSALYEFKNTLLNAGSEVSNAVFKYQTNIETLEWKELEVQSLSKAVKYSQNLLTNGYVSYLDVIIANQQLLTAQLDLIQTQYNQYSFLIELYQALGGGWR